MRTRPNKISSPPSSSRSVNLNAPWRHHGILVPTCESPSNSRGSSRAEASTWRASSSSSSFRSCGYKSSRRLESSQLEDLQV